MLMFFENSGKSINKTVWADFSKTEKSVNKRVQADVFRKQ